MSAEQQPLLSVIVTSYNRRDYIGLALDSILSQEGGYGYEIVVGDDYSTDGARDLLLEYQAKYPGIVKPIFNGKNLGMIGNYFNILANCAGKYIALCADDDYWLPGKMKLQLDFMEANPQVGMSYTRVRNEFMNERFRTGGYAGSELRGGPNTGFEELLYSCTVPAVSAMSRRELVLRYVDEVDPVGKGWLTEDYPLWLWMARESQVAFLNAVTAVYRVWDGSISNTPRLSSKLRFDATVAEIKRYYAERYYDVVPADLKRKYTDWALKSAIADRDFGKLAELRPAVEEIYAADPTAKSRRMRFGVRHPRLYGWSHGYYKRKHNKK